MRRTKRLLSAAATVISAHLIPAGGLTALSLGATACFLMNKGPSSVAKGLRYQSGNREYDQFFTALYEVQLTMGEAPEREAEIRSKLAKKLDVDEDDASIETIEKAVEERVQALANGGVGIKLAVTGLDADDETPSIDFGTTGGSPQGADRKVVNAIENAAKSAAELLGSMREAKLKTKKLDEQASALVSKVDETFRAEGPLKRGEVSKNLEDAQKLIPLMTDRSESVGEKAEELLEALEGAASAAAPAPPAPPEAPSETESPAPAPAPRAAPRRSRAAPKPEAPAAPAPPPPPPKPAAPPPPADDFEP